MHFWLNLEGHLQFIQFSISLISTLVGVLLEKQKLEPICFRFRKNYENQNSNLFVNASKIQKPRVLYKIFKLNNVALKLL